MYRFTMISKTTGEVFYVLTVEMISIENNVVNFYENGRKIGFAFMDSEKYEYIVD